MPPSPQRILGLLIVTAANLSFAQSPVISITNVWRYQQTSNFDGVNWTAPAFNDSSWSSGPALLYVENNVAVTPRNTPLILGQITYYFRTHFQYSNALAGIGLTFSILVDAGAVFYLTGLEIQRLRMPAPPQSISYGTLATSTPTGGDATSFDVFTVSGDVLTNLTFGDNVLAVEVHQNSAG